MTKLIREHLYVDDLIVSVDTVAEAIMLRKEISSIFGEIHMEIKSGLLTVERYCKLFLKKICTPMSRREQNQIT